MSAINLNAEEIAILRSALESAEYWEHRDVLPHDSGYILTPDPEDIEDPNARESWEEILAMRALDERLRELEREQAALDNPGSYTPGSWRHADFCKTPTGHAGDCWAENNRALGIEPGPAITIVEVKYP
jgi:hypothetical protein